MKDDKNFKTHYPKIPLAPPVIIASSGACVKGWTMSVGGPVAIPDHSVSLCKHSAAEIDSGPTDVKTRSTCDVLGIPRIPTAKYTL